MNKESADNSATQTINKEQEKSRPYPTLLALQTEVNHWIERYGVRYFDPLTNMAILTEEVGEVARIIARQYGEQSAKSTDDISRDKLCDELVDVLWVVTCLANQTGCDLTDGFRRNMEKKTFRDKNRHINNTKLTNDHGNDSK